MRGLLLRIMYVLIRLQRRDIWELKKRCIESKGFKKKCYIYAFEKCLDKKASWIGWESNIVEKPCFPHGISGIFISGGAVIGKNAVIFQQVTIGSNSLLDSHKQGSPVIGDNCYIGAGAKLIGRITIGNNCRIGAGTVVTKDIPDNSLVVGGDIRVIHKEDMDNRYVSQNAAGEKVYYANGEWKLLEKT